MVRIDRHRPGMLKHLLSALTFRFENRNVMIRPGRLFTDSSVGLSDCRQEYEPGLANNGYFRSGHGKLTDAALHMSDRLANTLRSFPEIRLKGRFRS
jgi:hypothetical protein